MIISISGKIGSGKDEIGKIMNHFFQGRDYIDNVGWIQRYNYKEPFEIKKFAHKVKQMASILLGVDISRFEDQEFKKTSLGEEWDNMTVREFLQKLGTDAMRMGLHENVWVNALFADYRLDDGLVTEPISEENKSKYPTGFEPPKQQHIKKPSFPNWIITDTRFPNELKAVEDMGGITIKVERFNPDGSDYGWGNPNSNHPSETALDDAEFDYVIVNIGTIEDLIKEVKSVLVEEEII